jgi:hypothetical protein
MPMLEMWITTFQLFSSSALQASSLELRMSQRSDSNLSMPETSNIQQSILPMPMSKFLNMHPSSDLQSSYLQLSMSYYYSLPASSDL